MSVPVLPAATRHGEPATADPVPPDATTVQIADTSRLEKVVDLAAIRHNVGVLRDAAAGRKVMAVVKGDRYGFGAVAVAGTVRSTVDAFAVNTVAEGLALRAAGIDTPTLVMDVDVADNATTCVEADLMPTIARVDQAERYAALGRQRGKRVTAWLRTNIGFNRFGARERAGFRELLAAVRRHRRYLRIIGVFAHLSSAAWEEKETAAQAAAFTNRLTAARAARRRHRWQPRRDPRAAARVGAAQHRMGAAGPRALRRRRADVPSADWLGGQPAVAAAAGMAGAGQGARRRESRGTGLSFRLAADPKDLCARSTRRLRERHPDET